MKEAYTEAKMELIEFENEDVITTSNLYVRNDNELPYIPNALGEVYDDQGNLIDIVE